jgi:hypothetical protein
MQGHVYGPRAVELLWFMCVYGMLAPVGRSHWVKGCHLPHL